MLALHRVLSFVPSSYAIQAMVVWPRFPALGRQKQKDQKFKVTLTYTPSSRPTWDTRDSVSETGTPCASCVAQEVVAHAFGPSTQEAEAHRSVSSRSAGLHKETLCQNKTKTKQPNSFVFTYYVHLTQGFNYQYCLGGRLGGRAHWLLVGKQWVSLGYEGS